MKDKNDHKNLFICKQDNCSREFQTIHSFRRHLTSKYSKSTIISATKSSPNLDTLHSQLPNSIPSTSEIINTTKNLACEDILPIENSLSVIQY